MYKCRCGCRFSEPEGILHDEWGWEYVCPECGGDEYGETGTCGLCYDEMERDGMVCGTCMGNIKYDLQEAIKPLTDRHFPAADIDELARGMLESILDEYERKLPA